MESVRIYFFSLLTLMVCGDLGAVTTNGRGCARRLITAQHRAFAWDQRHRLQPILDESENLSANDLNHGNGNTESELPFQILPLARSSYVDFSYHTDKFNWLSEDLRNLFLNRERLEIFKIPFVELRPNPQIIKVLYTLWVTPAPHYALGHRIGILLEDGSPVVVQDSNTLDEYLIEIIGFGFPTAANGPQPDQNDMENALFEPQGEALFENTRRAEKENSENKILALAFQRFTTVHGSQELVYRLLPGSHPPIRLKP